VSVRYQVRGGTAAEISASVEAGVRDGALVGGSALPPVRGLAESLGVSPATVAAAYKALRQRGVVQTAGRNGTRVRSRPPVAGTRSTRLLAVPAGALDLASGIPDSRLLPALGPRLRRLAASYRSPVSYGDAGPYPQLVSMARDRLGADGVPVPALTVTGGALDGIERVLTAHLRPGDLVGVEDPGWANLLDLVAALDLRPVAVPVDDDGPTEPGVRAALAAGVAAVVVTGRAHNPTGASLTRSRAAALRRALRTRPDTLVIEDDHAAELASTPLHPLAGATRHWALIRSVSKPYGPDLRLAVCAGDEATLARVEGRMRLGTGWVSTVLQRLVVELWRDPVVVTAVARARDSYDERRETLCAALAERGLAAHGRSGINVWVPVADETTVVAQLRDSGYVVAPGSLYRIGAPPGIRITVSPLDSADIPVLADALAHAVGAAPAREAIRMRSVAVASV
jgi:DNA-binding transcriptional MocR family regulator